MEFEKEGKAGNRIILRRQASNRQREEICRSIKAYRAAREKKELK